MSRTKTSKTESTKSPDNQNPASEAPAEQPRPAKKPAAREGDSHDAVDALEATARHRAFQHDELVA